MRGNFYLLAVFLFLCVIPVKGQFRIDYSGGAGIDTRKLMESDTVRRINKTHNFSNDFFDRAFWQAERRRLRKERNHIEFNATLQVTQTQFDNWASGGDNTFSGRSTIFFNHQYRKSKFSAESKFEARYGLNYIEKKKFKNEDQFTYKISTAWDINKHWSYSAMGNLRSQFTTSYKSRTDSTRVSTLMAPGFLDLSVGFKYVNKPFTIQLSPVGGSAVFVLDDELSEKGINGVEKGKRSKWTVGPSFQATLDWEFGKERKIFRLRSDLYSYSSIKKAPTMRFENTLDIRATKFLTTTLYALMYYDKQSEAPKPKKLQYQYSISVGLTYTFKNK